MGENNALRFWGLCLLCSLAAIANCAVAASPCEVTLGPASKREALLAQPDEAYRFVVRGSPAALAVARELVAADGRETVPVSLPDFDIELFTLRVQVAARICALTGIEQVWYLSPRLVASYENALKGLAYALETMDPPAVVNMSLGPPEDAYPLPGDDLEPMHHATKRLVDKGLVVVMAIGNYAESGGGSVVNPWCRPLWVICVGAASKDGGVLWPQSSRGDPQSPKTWPDVVAHGIDVIGPWPTNLHKSEARRRLDEANADFMRLVPSSERERYTLMSGSSQGAANVSRAVAQIIHFVRSLHESQKPQVQGQLFALEIPRERFEYSSRREVRLAGQIMRDEKDVVEIEYGLVEPWRLVKQLLIDTAIPMKGYAPHEVGAGFVDPEYVEKQFSRFGRVSPGLVPIKVQ